MIRAVKLDPEQHKDIAGIQLHYVHTKGLAQGCIAVGPSTSPALAVAVARAGSAVQHVLLEDRRARDGQSAGCDGGH